MWEELKPQGKMGQRKRSGEGKGGSIAGLCSASSLKFLWLVTGHTSTVLLNLWLLEQQQYWVDINLGTEPSAVLASSPIPPSLGLGALSCRLALG